MANNFDSPSMNLFSNDDLLQFINGDDMPGLYCPPTDHRNLAHVVATPGGGAANGGRATVPAPGSELMTMDLLGTMPKHKSPGKHLGSPGRIDLSMGIAGMGRHSGMDSNVLRMLGYKGSGGDTPLMQRPTAMPIPMASSSAPAHVPKPKPKNGGRGRASQHVPRAQHSHEPVDDVVKSLRVDENYKQHPWTLSNPDSSLTFAEVINFKRQLRQQNCVMCGLAGNKEVQIPAQNKDVCKQCDTAFWHNVSHDVVVKFCKGCKNFVVLGEFEDKPEASKCGKCRQRGRQNYFARKKNNSKPHNDDNEERDLDHSKGGRRNNNGSGAGPGGSAGGGDSSSSDGNAGGGTGDGSDAFNLNMEHFCTIPDFGGSCVSPLETSEPAKYSTPRLATKSEGGTSQLSPSVRCQMEKESEILHAIYMHTRCVEGSGSSSSRNEVLFAVRDLSEEHDCCCGDDSTVEDGPPAGGILRARRKETSGTRLKQKQGGYWEQPTANFTVAPLVR